jgi:soluble lytic murein transglycosylase-like protein
MRRFFRNFAQGTHCLSVGTLALGLGFGGLVPPDGAAPELVTPAAVAVMPAVAPPPAPAPVEQHPVPAEKPVPAVEAPQAPQPEQTAPAPAAPAPEIDPKPEPKPAPKPSPLHFLDTHDIPPGPFGKLIFEVAARYSLNPHLVAAIVRVESSFNPHAISRKGACGLMQLLPETARRFGLGKRKDLFDPAKNLEAGARYLKWLSDRFGQDPVRVLAAYNAGEGAVQHYGGVPPFKETRNYVSRIFSMLGLTAEAPKAAPDTALAR